MSLHRQLTKQVNSDRKRQLAVLLKEQKRRRGMVDLHFLCKNILGYEDLTDADGFHGDYCTHLTNAKKKFKLTLSPRGSLKSSIGTVGGTIQDIIVNPNVRILLASEKYTISTKFLSEIKGHFEANEVFRELYGDLVNDTRKGKWSESEIIVSNRTRRRASPTVSCAGIDVTKVGMHYDIIRVDDPHSDQNTTSQEQIDKVVRWYRLLLSLLDPGGYLYITGTIWHYNDLYNYIINKDRERVEAGRRPRFSKFIRDSFEGTNEQLMNDEIDESKLLWPERLSAEFLKEQYIEQGPYIFSCQYRLNPVDDDTAVFKRSWLQTCRWEDVPRNLNIYSVVDPMRDETGKDYLSIVTGGMSEDWKFYIFDIRRLKADEHDTIDTMYDVYQKYKPLSMGFETVAWQQSYLKYVKMLGVMKNIHLPIVPLKTSTRVTKQLRIKSMVPYFKAGMYILVCDGLDKAQGSMKVLIDELTRYPKVGNDDCVDALAYINQLTKRPGVLHILKTYPPNSFHAVRMRAIKPKKISVATYSVRKRHAK